MTAMANLVAALRDPASVGRLDAAQWSALLSVARAEVLLGTLAHRLDGQRLPTAVAAELAAVRAAAEQAQIHALWEAEMCLRALTPLGIIPILLKGTAYAAARLPNAPGRQIGDLDILVPRDRLDEVEAALLGAGWEWVKDDAYDQSYYRRWMHELPPMIHGERDRMIDVHHTILPLTARPRVDAAAMLADAVTTHDGWQILSPQDMIIHCAAHCMADGDLAGGLRNLWDMHCLLCHFGAADPALSDTLWERAARHDLAPQLARAIRLAAALFGTTAIGRADRCRLQDRYFMRRLLARDEWGRETRPLTRLSFYVRSHLLRMPPLMLARHLWIKWRR